MSTKTQRKPRKSKPDVTQRPEADSGDREWDAWKLGFDPTKRSHVLQIVKLFGGRKSDPAIESPLGWMLGPIESVRWEKIRRWHRSLIKAATKNKPSAGFRRLADDVIETVNAVDPNSADLPDALVLLAATHTLRGLAGNCSQPQWLDLVARILEFSRRAESQEGLSNAVYQILAIEIPLTIAFQVPEFENKTELCEQSWERLATALSDMLDHDGWPHARHSVNFGTIAASWVRCYLLMDKLDIELDFDSASQLEWLVRQIFRLRRPDGTLVFSDPQSRPISPAFIKSLFKLSHDPSDKPLRRMMSDGKPVNARQLPEPSNLSEWGESFLLQSGWGRQAPKLAVDFSRKKCITEISRRVSLIRGDSMPEVVVDGQALKPLDGFLVVCEESNDELEYVELQMDLGQGVTLNRQFLLARNEEFLMAADVIVSESDSRIEYRGQWPLAEGVTEIHESETRELYLQTNKIQSLVLPLALPEWKVDASRDRLFVDSGKLCLHQSRQGRGLYAPLIFDLSPSRSKRKRTWRQLTVAENLQPVRGDVAASFRFQIGKQQWFFYRQISSPGNRTFFGENFSGEFVFNRFDKHGTVTQLIQIQ